MTITSGMPSCTPIREIIGMRMIDDTVWEMKLDTVPAKHMIAINDSQGC